LFTRQRGPLTAYLTVSFSPWQYEDFEDVKVALMNTVLDAFELRFKCRFLHFGYGRNKT